MKNLLHYLFVVLFYTSCNQKIQYENNPSETENNKKSNSDYTLLEHEKTQEGPSFKWFTTVEESKMEIKEDGGVELSLWGFWKGTVDPNRKKYDISNPTFLPLETKERIAENDTWNATEIGTAYDSNSSRFYPNFK